MAFVTTSDGVEIFYKDWGPKDARPIVFHHGWPLSSDEWDAQMLFFLNAGYRVVAHDRRGHGRSAQVPDQHDMNRYAADAAAVMDHLELRGAVHIGHAAGGSEVAAYVARYGIPLDRVVKAVLVSTALPLLARSDRYPGGLPIDVLDGLRSGLAGNRAELFHCLASGPFYGFNRAGARILPAVIDNWHRQGMMGSAKAQCEGIKAFSETDQTTDLAEMTVPTLVLHGDDDQIVPVGNGRVLVEILPNATLNIYEGFSHGMLTVNADVINADLLSFIRA